MTFPQRWQDKCPHPLAVMGVGEQGWRSGSCFPWALAAQRVKSSQVSVMLELGHQEAGEEGERPCNF